jgi:hypothetical protein
MNILNILSESFIGMHENNPAFYVIIACIAIVVFLWIFDTSEYDG